MSLVNYERKLAFRIDNKTKGTMSHMLNIEFYIAFRSFSLNRNNKVAGKAKNSPIRYMLRVSVRTIFEV